MLHIQAGGQEFYFALSACAFMFNAVKFFLTSYLSLVDNLDIVPLGKSPDVPKEKPYCPKFGNLLLHPPLNVGAKNNWETKLGMSPGESLVET